MKVRNGRGRLAGILLATALAMTACGGSDSSSEDASGSDGTVASAKGESSGGESSNAAAGGTEAIAKAKDCKQLVAAATPVFTKLFQQLVDDTQKMAVQDLAKLGEDPESSDLFKGWMASVEKEAAAIDEATKKLKCSDADGQKALCDAVAGVKGDNPIAEAMITGMAQDCP